VEHSLAYAYRDRKNRKRSSAVWIIRINAGAGERALVQPVHRRPEGGGGRARRKVLADLAIRDPGAFAKLAEQAKSALASAAA